MSRVKSRRSRSPRLSRLCSHCPASVRRLGLWRGALPAVESRWALTHHCSGPGRRASGVAVGVHRLSAQRRVGADYRGLGNFKTRVPRGTGRLFCLAPQFFMCGVSFARACPPREAKFGEVSSRRTINGARRSQESPEPTTTSYRPAGPPHERQSAVSSQPATGCGRGMTLPPFMATSCAMSPPKRPPVRCWASAARGGRVRMDRFLIQGLGVALRGSARTEP